MRPRWVGGHGGSINWIAPTLISSNRSHHCHLKLIDVVASRSNHRPTHEPLVEAGKCEKLVEHMYFLEYF